MGQLIGYARVSTSAAKQKQTTDLQMDALNATGCERIFQDEASGAKADRKGLADLLEYARQGDILVVWRLDRLGRSLRHLIEVITDLEQRGIAFKSLCENIDTSTASGQLLFNIMGALAQFERCLITERVQAGLVAARKRGQIGGRPKSLDDGNIKAIRAMRAQGMTVGDICEAVGGVSRATYYRHCQDDRQDKQNSAEAAGVK